MSSSFIVPQQICPPCSGEGHIAVLAHATFVRLFLVSFVNFLVTIKITVGCGSVPALVAFILSNCPSLLLVLFSVGQDFNRLVGH